MRVTVTQKENIVAKECTEKFKKENEALRKEFDKYLTTYFSKFIPNFPKEILESNWIMKSAHVRIAVPKELRSKYNQKYTLDIYLTNPLPVRPHYGLSLAENEVDEKLTQLIEKKFLLGEKERDFKIDLKSALDCFSTSNQIVDNFPKLKKHFNFVKKANIVPMELIKRVQKQLEVQLEA